MSDNITYIDANHWDKEVLKSDKPVVVDFYSTECPPCDALAAKYEGLAALYGEDLTFVKVFRKENRDLS